MKPLLELRERQERFPAADPSGCPQARTVVTGIEESAGRSSVGRARGPVATIWAPSAATIAPLSVHSPGRGTRSRMPAASHRSCGQRPQPRVGRDAAADEQVVDAVLPAGEHRLAGQHVDDRLLEARRDVGDRHRLARRARAASTQRATAVLSPENEKSNRCRSRSRPVVRPRGKSMATRSPSRAARSTCGPPGNGRPSTRATLSNASPAASSIVAPSGRTSCGHVGHEQQRGVAAGDEQRQRRLGQRAVLDDVDGDVGGEVVDAVQRLAEGDGERLGRGDADQQRAGQPRAGRHRDRVEVARAGRPASRQARSIVGTIASRCARLATSGTTPPNRACSSTLLATASTSSVLAADDADAGLVAGGLDAEDQRLVVGHRLVLQVAAA